MLHELAPPFGLLLIPPPTITESFLFFAMTMMPSMSHDVFSLLKLRDAIILARL